MRVVVVGLGIQGNKRAAIAAADLVTTVDPANPAAKHKDIKDVPLEDFDAALVCTPDSAKFELLTYLLSNGKHVLVEKPLIHADANAFRRLADLSKKNRAVCYTAYNHRFEPHVVKAKKAIDSGALGKIHFAKMFYGNGTARDVRNSPWRDKDLGVLSDLGSHLLDTIEFLFGRPKTDFRPWSFDCFENLSYDHVIFGNGPSKEGPLIELEATLLSWRNTFHFDAYGELGSVHIERLCKWGPSVFTMRKRKLPSGKPDETRDELVCADPTWAAEYEHVKAICASGKCTNLDTDLWINTVLKQLGEAK